MAAGADSEHCGHGRVLDTEGVRRADWPDREGAGRLRDRERALPTISDWRWQLAGGGRGRARQMECTINGSASARELLARRNRHDPEDAAGLVWVPHGRSHGAAVLGGRLLSSIITFGPQPNKAIVGRNAFAHEAGIHQDGYLKEKTTYEIIDPRSAGVPEGKLVLGKHSGRHALGQRAEELAYDLSREIERLV